jgi:hypothetical protein
MAANSKLKNKGRFFRREFLNKDPYHGMAAIMADAKLPSPNATQQVKDFLSGETEELDIWGYDLFPTLTISDCSNSIDLELGCSSRSRYENSIYKINKLINVLQNLRNYMEAHGKAIAEDNELIKKKQEASK